MTSECNTANPAPRSSKPSALTIIDSQVVIGAMNDHAATSLHVVGEVLRTWSMFKARNSKTEQREQLHQVIVLASRRLALGARYSSESRMQHDGNSPRPPRDKMNRAISSCCSWFFRDSRVSSRQQRYVNGNQQSRRQRGGLLLVQPKPRMKRGDELQLQVDLGYPIEQPAIPHLHASPLLHL